MSQPYLHQLITGTARFSAKKGKEAGFITELSQQSELINFAKKIGKATCHNKLQRQALANMKMDVYHDVYEALFANFTFYSQL